MGREELEKLILSITEDIEFEYCGKHGAICPFSVDNIAMTFEKSDKTYSNIGDLMEDNVFYGKSLNDISEKLEIY